MGYAVACEGRTEWAVALPCGMAALLTPFLVVPWTGNGRHPGGQPGMSVHMAHTSCQHGPARVAGQGSRDILVLVVAHGAWYMGAMVRYGAPLGKGWQCCSGVP